MTTQRLFDIEATPRLYHDSITASVNSKGCMDVDTVKGCTPGMSAKEGGCYGECYAAKVAYRYGIKFEESVVRGFVDRWQHRDILVRREQRIIVAFKGDVRKIADDFHSIGRL